MKYSAISGELKRMPFRPFRVIMHNGQAFDVRHPELIKLAISEVYIFRPSGDDVSIPESVVAVCGIDNISLLQPLRETAA